jgi:hypothetical protein
MPDVTIGGTTIDDGPSGAALAPGVTRVIPPSIANATKTSPRLIRERFRGMIELPWGTACILRTPNER